jgi:hypothetical protein
MGWQPTVKTDERLTKNRKSEELLGDHEQNLSAPIYRVELLGLSGQQQINQSGLDEKPA